MLQMITDKRGQASLSRPFDKLNILKIVLLFFFFYLVLIRMKMFYIYVLIPTRVLTIGIYLSTSCRPFSMLANQRDSISLV